MPKQNFYLYVVPEGNRPIDVGPREKGLKAWLHTGSEHGMSASSAPSVEVECHAASAVNRLYTHVGLRNERTSDYQKVLMIVSRIEEHDPQRPEWDSPPIEPGVYLCTPKGRRVTLADALAAIDLVGNEILAKGRTA